jgi:hypothetical protein
MTSSINLGAHVFNHSSLATIGGKRWHPGPQQRVPLRGVFEERISSPRIERQASAIEQR